MKSVLITLTLLGAAFAADTKQSCPVEIHPKPDYVQSQRVCPEIRMCDAIEIVNHSDKKIVGAKFHMIYLDSVGDPMDNGFDYTANDKVKPGKRNLYIWNTKYLVEDKSQGAIAWVMKILYDDGTTWVDDGSKSCSAKSK